MKNRNIIFAAVILIALGCFALPSATQAVPLPPAPTNVNVVNTPNVNVANTTGSPVPVRDVDNLARQIVVQAAGVTGFSNGSDFGGVTIETVPAGKRLIIEHVSVFGEMLPNQKMVQAFVITNFSDTHLRISAQGSNAGGSKDYFVASEQVLCGAIEQTQVEGIVLRDSTAGDNPSSVRFEISGYLVDM
jgi:hypothetical protein